MIFTSDFHVYSGSCKYLVLEKGSLKNLIDYTSSVGVVKVGSSILPSPIKASCYWISNEVLFLFILANVLIRRVASIILGESSEDAVSENPE